MEQGDGSSVGFSNYDTEPMEKNCGGDGSSDSDFLCARSKTHLIRCDGSPVEIASLRGKIVGILFFLYGKGGGEKGALSYDNLLDFKAFKEVYEWTREVKGDVFEIVSVGLGSSSPDDDDKQNWELQRRMFDELILPDMPWLAVPFDEWEWRERLRVKYINSDFGSFDIRIDIVDGTSGRLVCESADSFIRNYGPYSYPFTYERMDEVFLEGERMLKQKSSLGALLGDSGSGHDFLLSNNGTKVPISQLQGKPIGLYLCRETPFSATYPFSGNDCSGPDKVIVEFLLTCPSDFKIVIINDHLCGGYTDETSLLRVLNRLPNNWFALPFKNVKTRALLAKLSLFATVGPDGDLLCNPYRVFQRYEFDAYPFTLRAAATVEIQRLTNLTLTDVFEVLHIDYVYKKLGPGAENYALSSFPFPTPDKKGVVLYIHHCLSLPEASRLLDLSLSSPFHVIFYDSANTFEDFVKLLDTMPMQWSAFPHGYHFFDFDKLGVIFPEDGHVIAFGSDGNLLKVGTLESFGRHDNDVFPFISQEDFIMTVEKYLAEYLAASVYSRRFFLV